MNAIRSVMVTGAEPTVIDVECHISNGLPGLAVIGHVSKSVDESRERVRAAFTQSNIQLPRKRITINLAPAEIPKNSSAYDVAIAVSILHTAGLVRDLTTSHALFIGELGLNGDIKPVRGIIGMLLGAKKLGYKRFYIPYDNVKQANLVPEIEVIAPRSLRDLYEHLTNTATLKVITSSTKTYSSSVTPTKQLINFNEVVGQVRAKRALEIAAAGGHNVLLNGPPGAGKSMLAKALIGILPQMNNEEMLEVTHLHSLSNNNYDQIINERPFRSPHHTSSHTSIIGGGQNPKPGEISLSHNGVLLLDEFPEYSRATLESLRQPLEDRVVSVARSKGTVEFPANFMLIATSNPCPCGYYGSSKPCSCTPHKIDKYMKRLSGPIIDRIDLYVEVDGVEHTKLLEKTTAEPSKSIRERVMQARRQQQLRANVHNSQLTNKSLKSTVKLSAEGRKLLDAASKKLDLSARGYMRTLKVARTIADLEKSEEVSPAHVSEALQYRKKSI